MYPAFMDKTSTFHHGWDGTFEASLLTGELVTGKEVPGKGRHFLKWYNPLVLDLNTNE